MSKQIYFRFISVFVLCAAAALTALAQTPPTNSGKKNVRPNGENSKTEKAGQEKKSDQKSDSATVFSFDFAQPQFTNSHIVLTHDEAGKGKIVIRKKDLDEDFTDPIQLSPVTLEKVKELWEKLNFLDSTEDYQSTVRDYPHLGTLRFKLKKDGREREAVFNWTENLDAKALADEYKKLGYQFAWMFDMAVARESMPLDAPRVMQDLNGYLRRNEISDPPSLIPYLRRLADDERIPLIARNSATRMIADIEKKAAKK